MSNKNRALLFDVLFLSIIGIIGELINHAAITRISPQYYFSITLIIAFIAIYRLGYLGAIPAIVIAIVFSTINEGATIQTFAVYIIGNGFIVVAAFFLNKVGRYRIVENTNWSILYVLVGYLSIVIGRGTISFFLDSNTNYISALFLMLSNEFLSIIAVAILFSMAAKRKSLLIDIRKLYQEAIED